MNISSTTSPDERTEQEKISQTEKDAPEKRLVQGVLPYKLEVDTSKTQLTGLAGLPIYLDLAQVVGLRDSIAAHVQLRSGTQGWTDAQMLTTLILLNLAGGQCVEDLEKLEGDLGFATILHRVETFGMKRSERRRLERRWRKSKERKVPSVSAMRRFLAAFHDAAEEARRESGAFIPQASHALSGLSQVNADCAQFLQEKSPQTTATLDMDATLIESHKKEAHHCYKGFRAFQPLNVWWAEQQFLVHSEFRDGNVPAGFEQLRVLKESLELLPEGVEKVSMRSDTAGYQWDLLRYCAEGKSERFGVIDFAVGANVTQAFKNAVHEVKEKIWHPLHRLVKGEWIDTGQQWAEVCFVPSASAVKKDGPTYRFLAIREPLRQMELPGVESDQLSLPFPTITYSEEGEPRRFKLFGVVTNLELPGDEVIRWLRERCGKSEEVHAVMKDDLAGGRLPSKLFGANAAWWSAMILALNLNLLMKRLVLGGRWVTQRMKAIRYWIINLPGRLVGRSRQLTLKLSGDHPSTPLLLEARRTLADLALGPSG